MWLLEMLERLLTSLDVKEVDVEEIVEIFGC